MPNSTTNYNLKKPLSNENYNIQDSNDNMDIIDTALKYLDDKIDDLADEGNTKTVKQLENEVTSHKAENATNTHLAKNIGLEDAEGHFEATDVEGALNELFTSVSDGKNLISGAIADVDPEVEIPANPTFQDLAGAIELIETGTKKANGQATSIGDTLTVSNLEFTPSFVIVSAYWGGNCYLHLLAANNVFYRPTASLTNMLIFSFSDSTATAFWSGGAFNGDIQANGFYVSYSSGVQPDICKWWAFE